MLHYLCHLANYPCRQHLGRSLAAWWYSVRHCILHCRSDLDVHLLRCYLWPSQTLHRRPLLWHNLHSLGSHDDLQILGFDHQGRFGILSWFQAERLGSQGTYQRRRAITAELRQQQPTAICSCYPSTSIPSSNAHTASTTPTWRTVRSAVSSVPVLKNDCFCLNFFFTYNTCITHYVYLLIEAQSLNSTNASMHKSVLGNLKHWGWSYILLQRTYRFLP